MSSCSSAEELLDLSPQPFRHLHMAESPSDPGHFLKNLKIRTITRQVCVCVCVSLKVPSPADFDVVLQSLSEPRGGSEVV